MAKEDFIDNPLYTITGYIWCFAAGAFFFSICSIFLILTVLVYSNNLFTDGIIFFGISLSLEGPAFTALLSVMGKLIREKDVDIAKDYFKAYKTNFLQSLCVSFFLAILLALVSHDLSVMNHSNSTSPITKPLLFAGLFIPLIISLYVFPIISRFYISIKDVVKLSIYYSVKNFKITILIISVLILDYLLMNLISIFIAFILSSLVCYIIMYYIKDVLKEIESKINPGLN